MKAIIEMSGRDEPGTDDEEDDSKYVACVPGWPKTSMVARTLHFANDIARELTSSMLNGWGMNFVDEETYLDIHDITAHVCFKLSAKKPKGAKV